MVRRFAAAALFGALALVARAQDGDESTAELVAMTTNLGTFYIELHPEEAPKTVENFLRYVEDDFYDGTVFHRVIPGFVIQGGGFDEDLERRSTREPIENEADNGLKNERGTLSMARTSAVDSATSQFFVNLVDNPPLDHTGTSSSRAWGYAVFGKVVRGMDVIDAIAATPTGPAGPFRGDVPQEAVVVEDASIVTALPDPGEGGDEAPDDEG